MNDIIIKAARTAANKHCGQLRKYGHNVPYIMHPIRVAGMIAIHPNSSPELVAASYLHDTIEDTTYTSKELMEDFGETVHYFVMGLTNPSKQFQHLHRDDRKKMDREHIANCSNKIKLIKLVDRIDNLKDMNKAPLDFLSLYVKESQRLLDEALRGVDLVYEHEYEDTLKYLGDVITWREKHDRKKEIDNV
jgi:(p)ppGpp synthase/HD superfamily hydrolase